MPETEKIEVPEKVKKEKKVLTPERLEQLAKARHRALEIRKAGAAIKTEQREMEQAALEEKLERERLLNEAVKKSLIKNEINNEGLHPVPLYRNNVVPNLIQEEEEEEEEEEQPIIVKKKIKKPIKTRIIVEQSSDDCDDYESSDRVIFVKRKSKNDSIKKVPATTPVPPNTPEEQYVPTPTVSRKPQPEFTNFVDMMANNGGFINRRKYY